MIRNKASQRAGRAFTAIVGGLFLTLVISLTAPAQQPPLHPTAGDPTLNECFYCHDIHGAPGFDALTNQATVEAVCMACHGPGGISTLKADVHVNDKGSKYPAFRFTCNDCHDSHRHQLNWLGGTNLKAVGDDIFNGTDTYARIDTPNSGIREVVFESRGTDAGEPSLYSFADADEDGNNYYDGVCETCHTLTKHHRNNTSGGHTHNTGKTCTRCHSHVTNFNR